jgi:hypothetical protein
MALGAMANDPKCQVKIVPVGLSYFHAHRFRSRAVVEFGQALDVPAELVEMFKEGGTNKKVAVTKFLDLIYNGLKTVTVRAPDYDTLMASPFNVPFSQILRGFLAHPSCTSIIQDSRTAPYSWTSGRA